VKCIEKINYLPGAEPLYLEGSNIGCLLLHGGGGGTAWDLKEIAHYLHEKLDATVWLPSLKGFGTKPEDLYNVSFSDWLDDAQNGINRLKESCDTIIILGHSFGGLLSYITAAENQSISAVISWAGAYGIKDRRLAFLPYIIKIPLLRRIVPEKFPMNPSEDNIKQGWVGYDWLPISIVSSFIEGINTLKRSLPKVTCPSLIIQGTLDESVTQNSPTKIYNSINSVKKEILLIEGAHHPLMQEEDFKGELFNKTIQFINQVITSS
jgi:carboxylesterase